MFLNSSNDINLNENYNNNFSCNKYIPENASYSCDQCEYKALLKLHLKVHLRKFHENVKYSCDLCDYKTKWKSSFDHHIKSFEVDHILSFYQFYYKANWQVHLKKHIKSILWIKRQNDWKKRKKKNVI